QRDQALAAGNTMALVPATDGLSVSMVSAGWLRLRRRPKAVPAQPVSAGAGINSSQRMLEREFQAAMQFYSRGGGSGGGMRRLRLCQEPLVPYKPLASASQSKSQKAAAAATARDRSKNSRRPSKDGAVPNRPVAAAASLVSGPTPLTALLGASQKTAKALLKSFNGSVSRGQPALRRSKQLRRVDNSTDLATPPADRRRHRRRFGGPRTPPRRFCGKSSRGRWRPVRPRRRPRAAPDRPQRAPSGAATSGASRDCTCGPAFPRAEPVRQPPAAQGCSARFARRSRAPEPSHPDAWSCGGGGSGQWRHEVFIGGPPGILVCLETNFDQ
uniref:AP2/ERF domain-containing protein n=1 Tax=Macrostomum lignano TaxID=282301 RepID=A0A1I8FQX8_9PLAT